MGRGASWCCGGRSPTSWRWPGSRWGVVAARSLGAGTAPRRQQVWRHILLRSAPPPLPPAPRRAPQRRVTVYNSGGAALADINLPDPDAEYDQARLSAVLALEVCRVHMDGLPAIPSS